MATRMQQRRGTAAQWQAANHTLADGEIGYETDTKIVKIGDGVTPWNTLRNPVKSRAVADQTQNLAEFLGSDGTVLARVSSSGAVVSEKGGLFGPGAAGSLGAGLVGLGVQPQAANGQGLVVRGASGQTANLAEFQTNTGEVLALVRNDGGILTKSALKAGSATADYIAMLQSTVPEGAAGVKGLVVRGASGQTANLAEFQDNSGTSVATVSNNGTISGLSILAKNDGAFFATGATPDFMNAQVNVKPFDITRKGLVVRGISGQSANLIELQNSSGTATMGFRNDGTLFFASSHISGSANAGSNGAPPAQVAGYMMVFDANSGAYRKVPLYLP